MDEIPSKSDLVNQSGSVDDENLDNSVVTMVDVLEDEKLQEHCADVLLGNADDKNCTYSQGYLPRQPLYACKTCAKDKLAGVCLACSYKCHEGHELVELYTKRNFRCDCGNSLFSGLKCSLDPFKDETNEDNAYNQNFKGLYCTCHRPYPDEEDTVKDEMVQCVICEDWYHKRHLKMKEDVSITNDMACQLCMDKLPFLKKLPLVEASETTECKIASIPEETESSQAVVLPVDWRKRLCRCSKCLEIYSTSKVEFLLDEKDSLEVYEAKGEERAMESEHDREMRALSTLDRVQQIEVIQNYNEMKNALMEHLKKFKDDNRVVCESDILEFFDTFKAKRRRVLVPPTCH